MRLRATLLALVAGTSLSAALAAPALALTQVNGDTIPGQLECNSGQPLGILAALACACTTPGVCNIGVACPGGSTSCDNGQHGTCESTLWHSPNDNSCIPSNQSGLNPYTASQILPETFHPTCGQTFTVISRGDAIFHDVFGWYNATTGTPPDPTDLHVMIGCTDGIGTQVTLDVLSDPSYKGGDIGFFMMTPADHTTPTACAAGTNCCPSVALIQSGQGYVYYTQKEFNPDLDEGQPYVHVLNLASLMLPNRFYFAWEDWFATADTDFADLVTAVDGVQCSGAGQQCNTGLQGTCALGVTACAQGATTPTCQQLFQPQPDTCNGLDDDCSGIVDNGATCPTPGNVCVNGQCVGPCSLENPCAGGLTCDTSSGQCVDPTCVGVSCRPNQVCVGGQCETACAGVVCPQGQTCVNNACVDLCQGVTCASGEVCSSGLCFAGCATCGGVTCSSPLSCDTTSGACFDASCTQTCPAGTVCSSGACVDGCTGVACPSGQTCSSGECAAPGVPTAAPAGSPEAAAPRPRRAARAPPVETAGRTRTAAGETRAPPRAAGARCRARTPRTPSTRARSSRRWRSARPLRGVVVAGRASRATSAYRPLPRRSCPAAGRGRREWSRGGCGPARAGRPW